MGLKVKFTEYNLSDGTTNFTLYEIKEMVTREPEILLDLFLMHETEFPNEEIVNTVFKDNAVVLCTEYYE